MAFGPADVAHDENFLVHQKHLKKTNCCTRDLWLLVGPVAGVTPLAILQNLFRPQRCRRSGPLLRNSRCPKPVQIPGLRTETRLSYAHSSQIADWETNIQSGLLLSIWNGWSHSETPNISALYGSTFYRPVYFYKPDFIWNYNPVWSSPTRHLNIRESVATGMTSQSGQQLPKARATLETGCPHTVLSQEHGQGETPQDKTVLSWYSRTLESR